MSILFFLIVLLPGSIYGEFPISIVDQKIFQDINGHWNLIGVVESNEATPLEVKVSVNITKPNNVSSILTSNTFTNVIYPYTAAPFKFTISSNELFKGLAYHIETKKIAKPFFMELRQNYSNFATDDEKALVGTIKNKGSNIIKNVAVYASVHSINGTQIDSVKSTVIPVIYPNEEISYKIIPDDAIKDDVYFYSCAGLDINAPISTLSIGNGEYIVFNLESVSAISNFRYENSSDSIIFEIKPYNPVGGPTIFQIPQISSNQKIDIFLDGKQYENKIVTMDGKTISMNIFIPKDKHEVKISGIRNQL
ncbi:MAG TPA: hypothetical protein VHJ38_16720 [Nitrososphaeraceae archaeon]|nr:hypothetical protein [Nitrososphaeraceae archaeon]